MKKEAQYTIDSTKDLFTLWKCEKCPYYCARSWHDKMVFF